MFWKSFKHGNSWYQFIRVLECISCNFTWNSRTMTWLLSSHPWFQGHLKELNVQPNSSHGPRVQRSAESNHWTKKHPGRWSWNPKVMKVRGQMISRFKQVIFRFHVNFPGCTTYLTGKTWWCSVMSHITKFSNWTCWPLPTFTEKNHHIICERSGLLFRLTSVSWVPQKF